MIVKLRGVADVETRAIETNQSIVSGRIDRSLVKFQDAAGSEFGW
jgi:hypothetical protein